jgi:hypothetical protein
MDHRIVMTAACVGLALIATPGAAHAASVGCTPDSTHPVCKANYAAYPKGALAAGQASAGTAVVDGKTVRWTCLGGVAAGKRSTPRKCSY